MNAPKTHELKCWEPFFSEVESGVKTFDVRRDDRNYHVGDILVLRRYDPKADAYNGAFLYVKVAYVLRPEAFRPLGLDLGLADGFCVLGIVRQS